MAEDRPDLDYHVQQTVKIFRDIGFTIKAIQYKLSPRAVAWVAKFNGAPEGWKPPHAWYYAPNPAMQKRIEDNALTQFDRGVRCGEELIGTCSSIEKEAEEDDDFEGQAFCDGVDSVAFECEGCGWWCEAGEANENPDGGGDVCDDCAPSSD